VDTRNLLHKLGYNAEFTPAHIGSEYLSSLDKYAPQTSGVDICSQADISQCYQVMQIRKSLDEQLTCKLAWLGLEMNSSRGPSCLVLA